MVPPAFRSAEFFLSQLHEPSLSPPLAPPLPSTLPSPLFESGFLINIFCWLELSILSVFCRERTGGEFVRGRTAGWAKAR